MGSSWHFSVKYEDSNCVNDFFIPLSSLFRLSDCNLCVFFFRLLAFCCVFEFYFLGVSLKVFKRLEIRLSVSLNFLFHFLIGIIWKNLVLGIEFLIYFIDKFIS